MWLKCDFLETNALSSFQGKTKSSFSYLLLGRKSATNGNMYLMVSTCQNKTGTYYKISSNIEKVFKKFVHEGKVTIRLKEPSVDLCIRKADPVQLKFFLTVLYRLSVFKVEHVEQLPLLRPAKTDQVKRPQTVLTITSREQYPSIRDGFPKRLEVLEINECQLLQIEPRVMRLQNLTSLNLSRNKIRELPAELASNSFPSLKLLDLSNNELTAIPENFFSPGLQASLVTLRLHKNNISALPQSIESMRELTILNLDENKLTALPDNLGCLPRLQTLTVSFNQLEYLPGSFAKLRLTSLEVCSNNFQATKCTPKRIEDFPATLMEWAARSVVKNKVPYVDQPVPRHLVKLLQTASWCICGSPCFEHFFYVTHTFDLRKITESVVLGGRDTVLMPFKTVVCSSRCKKLIKGT